MSGRPRHRPQLTRNGKPPTYAVRATDEFGDTRELNIAGESSLTIYLDKREVVTLMTLGTHPEALVLGYLRNQRLVRELDDVLAVQVDWEVEAAAVTTTVDPATWLARLERRTITTGCGQGTVYGDVMTELDSITIAPAPLRQSTLYALLKNLNAYNEVYRSAGAVHGCALCQDSEILLFVEDVGRHNAVDAINGLMWLAGLTGADKIFYTTGRLTSEMVIKVAQMGIPTLLSRSGITRMGLAIAERLGVTLIGRAKGQHFLLFTGQDRLERDAMPVRAPARDKTVAS